MSSNNAAIGENLNLTPHTAPEALYKDLHANTPFRDLSRHCGEEATESEELGLLLDLPKDLTFRGSPKALINGWWWKLVVNPPEGAKQMSFFSVESHPSCVGCLWQTSIRKQD